MPENTSLSAPISTPSSAMEHHSTITNWEDMELDCLFSIFSKIGLDDLIASIPFVCKTWSQASSHPLLYHTLDFHLLHNLNPSSSLTSFLKLSMSRSHGAAFELRFSPLFSPSIDVLSLASITCPRLKTLHLPQISFVDESPFLDLIRKWRDLEWLEMESKPSNFREMAEQIGMNCNKFHGLKIRGLMKMEDVLGIVNFLPKIEVLDLSGSQMGKEEVLVIVDGCRELKRLSVNECVGFEVDEEVKSRGSGIEVFEFEGCRVEDDFGNIMDQDQVLEQMIMYYDDCFEMWMF